MNHSALYTGVVILVYANLRNCRNIYVIVETAHLSPAVHGEDGHQHRDNTDKLPEADLDHKDKDAGDEEDYQSYEVKDQPVHEEPPVQECGNQEGS